MPKNYIIDITAKNATSETDIIKGLLPSIKFPEASQKLIIRDGKDYINNIRASREFSIEQFIHRFNLSTDEGVAIMYLSECLLRVPDSYTAKQVIFDKLKNKTWLQYVTEPGHGFRTFFASLGLMIAGNYVDIVRFDNIVSSTIDRLGSDLFLKALKKAILLLSKEFVFAENMVMAANKRDDFSDYSFAFDLLGESARTMNQAEKYHKQYQDAVKILASVFKGENELHKRPNLSVKLTALHPRFELSNWEELEKDLYPKVKTLVQEIAKSKLTITFDAEESFRLDTYLMFLTKLLTDKDLGDFDGIGLVIQGYQTRSFEVLSKLIEFIKKNDKRINIRLVKGAYWDTEIKHAQVLGLAEYPVFTRKEYTDANYIACAKLMLENSKHIYSQFATHNALSAAYIKELAGDKEFEFQKLHGMGNALHEQLKNVRNVRIYAPVGNTNDLLAYLMRRMLENGANSSFVGQVIDPDIEVDSLAYDLHDRVIGLIDNELELPLPKNIYPNRKNAMGYDLGYKTNYDYIQDKVASFYSHSYIAGSIIDGKELYNKKHGKDYFSPAKNAEKIASICHASSKDITDAINSADMEFNEWSRKSVQDRASILHRVADLYEKNKFKLYAILIQEGGKSIQDAINEVIEAIDFCRYYAEQAKLLMREQEMAGPTGEKNLLKLHARGVFLCISPWNFPLAIFTGQIVAALVTGNTVIAKPADQTSITANIATKLMHEAGVPSNALQLLLARGSSIGKYAVTDAKVRGVVFTGSTETAATINKALAERKDGIIPIIAETGGQNAMIVDSSALLEQVTDDVIHSAFYSAGQRCSALRMLYIQDEIYDDLLSMIEKAMELLKIGNTADFSRDIGPVIDKASFETLTAHIANMEKKGFKVHPHPRKGLLKEGHYFYPHIVEVKSINDVPEEQFGPILHVAKFKSKNLDKTLEEINSYGYGLTFGIHTRLEERIEYIRSRIKVGNIYANRTIIGAKVESQPFGGENKSGTGFKAGGPHYLLRFTTERTKSINLTAIGGNIELMRS